MSSCEALLEEFKDGMKTFERTDLGRPQYFLGLEVNQSKNGVFISQQKYAESLLKKFQM